MIEFIERLLSWLLLVFLHFYAIIYDSQTNSNDSLRF